MILGDLVFRFSWPTAAAMRPAARPQERRTVLDAMEEMMRAAITLGWATIGLVVSAGIAIAEPVTIRTSWVAPVTNWASIWLEKKDLAKHLGQTYLVEPTQFQGTPPMITALANNQLEISNLAYSTLGIAIENAGLSDLRIVADEFQDGVDGYYSQEYMVLKDSTIHKVEDLKGKVIATNAAGSAIDIAMRAMLHKHGLEANRDYTMVEAPFPAMRAMLAEHKVDLISSRPSILVRSRTAQHRARSIHPEGRHRRCRHDRVDSAQTVHRQEPRRISRFFRRHLAHYALVSRSEQPRRGATDCGTGDKAPAAELRLAVHKKGHLSRSEHAAEPRRATEERRPHARAGLREVKLRPQGVF
jgi:hypothetical protein